MTLTERNLVLAELRKWKESREYMKNVPSCVKEWEVDRAQVERAIEIVVHVEIHTLNSKSALQDLGFANGWDDDPEIVRRCRNLMHEREYKDIGSPNRGQTEIKCETCGYVYRYDSSD